MEKYLPNGSVVLLKNANKKLMIYGRKQEDTGNGKVCDYVGCPYPEGNVDLEHTFIFDHDDIERVFFIGFQDDDEIEYNKYLLKSDRLVR